MSLLGRLGRRLPTPLRVLARRSRALFALRDRLEGTPAGPAPQAGEYRPVVYLPTWLRWDVMRQRPQFLLQALAGAGHEVWFVDPLEPSPRCDGGVHIVPSLRHVPARHPILYTHFAPTRTLFDRFDDPVVVYDILDDLTIYDPDEIDLPQERRVRNHHPVVMATADVVIASNPILKERHQAERSDDILLVENGVDVERFGAAYDRPPDLPKGPIAGFHGAIGPWIDIDLIEDVARELPDVTFVFVGPVHGDIGDATDRLGAHNNIVLLGERKSSEIAAYVAAFDVGVMWFKINELTEGVTPLKMWEYLAAGVPVVSTPLPAALATPGVRTAHEPKELAVRIREGIESRRATVDERRSLAAGADWRHRIEPLLSRLDELGKRAVP